MRELARRIGVSNAASTRHFHDKRALMTALATDGWTALGDSLDEAWTRRKTFSDVGKAYVRFAVSDTAHFEVVGRPELYDADDATLVERRERVFGVVLAAMAEMGVPEPLDGGIAAWALVHGLAMLHLQGLLPAGIDDPVDAFVRTSRFMFQVPPQG